MNERGLPRFGELHRSDLDADPMEQFARWFDETLRAGLNEPYAMTLATADAQGVPSARTVLLKGHDERGFMFFTNHESRKGSELAVNPNAALVFYWNPLDRQVCVRGTVRRVRVQPTSTGALTPVQVTDRMRALVLPDPPV